MIASPTIRRRMAGCIALMESPNAGEAEAARTMLAKLERKYGPYVAESTISRGGRTASDFGHWAHKAGAFDDGPPKHYNCRSSAPSDAKDIQPWEDADMADLASECARWLWLSGWYCEASDINRWNVCPDAEYGNWIKYGISNEELIRFAHEKGFGAIQLGEAGDRLTQFHQAIGAPEFDIAKAKPGERAPRTAQEFRPKQGTGQERKYQMTGRKYIPEPLDDEFDDDPAIDDGFREGQIAALDGMDLPDGAYFAMAEDMGIDLDDLE